jgi:hypothetical protein
MPLPFRAPSVGAKSMFGIAPSRLVSVAILAPNLAVPSVDDYVDTVRPSQRLTFLDRVAWLRLVERTRLPFFASQPPSGFLTTWISLPPLIAVTPP